ncbi:MAG: hypothetical protein HZR80_00970 [Candidatus Heimdallarchaeota archaeon]
MLANIIENVLQKYYFKIQSEIKKIRNLLSVGQHFIDLLDGEIFYKGLSDRLPGNLLTSEFEIIVSDEKITKEKKEELNFYQERFEYNYFKFLDLLFFASESKFPITPDALKQLHIRFIGIIAPLKNIYKLLEDILEDILEDEGDEELVDEDDLWDEFFK